MSVRMRRLTDIYSRQSDMSARKQLRPVLEAGFEDGSRPHCSSVESGFEHCLCGQISGLQGARREMKNLAKSKSRVGSVPDEIVRQTPIRSQPMCINRFRLGRYAVKSSRTWRMTDVCQEGQGEQHSNRADRGVRVWTQGVGKLRGARREGKGSSRCWH